MPGVIYILAVDTSLPARLYQSSTSHLGPLALVCPVLARDIYIGRTYKAQGENAQVENNETICFVCIFLRYCRVVA